MYVGRPPYLGYQCTASGSHHPASLVTGRIQVNSRHVTNSQLHQANEVQPAIVIFSYHLSFRRVWIFRCMIFCYVCINNAPFQVSQEFPILNV